VKDDSIVSTASTSLRSVYVSHSVVFLKIVIFCKIPSDSQY
jgi:hypothetical protein